MSPRIPYSKPWQSHADLVGILIQRGLIVTDKVAAEEFLAHVNYYRLSGYCLAFESPGQRHSFTPGTTFDQLRASYEFDFELRDLVSEALEIIEIDLRTTVAHYFGKQHGAFGHLNPSNFFHPRPLQSAPRRPPFNHASWLFKVREETQRSKERFVEHFRQTYAEATTHDLPIWALSEVMAFGSLSRMIDGMHTSDQQAVARRYGLQENILVSWVHHLNIARNVCAHHSRLWDRYWTIQPRVPYGNAWRNPHLQSNTRLPITLLILYQLLKRITDASAWTLAWKSRLHAKLKDLPDTPATSGLGFSTAWFANPLWT